MANTNNKHGFLWEKTNQAGAVKLNRWKSVSAAAIKVGDPLVLASGYLKLAGVTSTGLYGIAAEAVTSAAGVRKSLAIIPFAAGHVFSAQHGSTLNLTAGYFGKRCGIMGTTNGKIALNAAATTSVLEIVGLKPGSAWGTYAELLVTVVRSTYDGSIR